MPTATDAQREAGYFDELVRERGEFNPFADRGWSNLARWFAEMVRPAAPSRVLDIGCGTGRSRCIYAPHASSYIGIDLSVAALRKARSEFPVDDWVGSDARSLPFAAASFDVVSFSSVLHHIPDYRRALSEALRVLRPGGRVFAFDPNLLHPAMALFRWPRSPFYIAEGVSPQEAPLLARSLRREFVAAGFADVRQRAHSDLPYRAVAPRLLNAGLALYNAGDWLLARSGLGRWFGTFILTAGRAPEA